MTNRPSDPEVPSQRPDDALTPADLVALDALADAGWSGDGVSGHALPRAERLASILDLLAPAPAQAAMRSALIDATLARALRAPAVPSAAASAALTDEDSAALSALVDAGWQANEVTHEAGARAARTAALLAMLEHSPIEPGARADLIQSTLDRVAARRIELGLDEARPVTRGSFRLRDLVAAAAIFLVSVTVIWPTIVGARESARQAECEAGLVTAGFGFGAYAADHRGELPRSNRALGSMSGGACWWNVGVPAQSHSANLFTLIATGYATLSDLACSGNAVAPVNLETAGMHDWRRPEEVSYSYQLFTTRTPRWVAPVRMVVLTDRSPAVDRARRGETIDPAERSHNHRGLGQNVLFNDGSVEWLTSPSLPGGDNLWTPRGWASRSDLRLDPSDRPVDESDAFVGP